MNTHTYNNATLGDNISIFEEVCSAAFGETFVVTFCQKIQYHILILFFFSYFTEYYLNIQNFPDQSFGYYFAS